MDERLEQMVAEFVLAREADPRVDAASFVEQQAGDPSIDITALRSALDGLQLAETLLPAPASGPSAIGPYRVVSQLGRGAAGAVFAVDRAGQRFALKWLTASTLLAPRSQLRFTRECAILARLEHPGIVRIVDHGTAEGVPFLVMELVEGSPLATDRRSVADAVGIVRRLAEAVGAAHREGVVHRDLKPSNVMLRGDASPVLIDFGLGTLAEDASLTDTGAVLGTPGYMAPEQALGEGSDARADVFALGVILHELLRGRPVRRGSTRARVLSEAAYRSVRRLTREDAVPAALSAIVAQATARRPAWRYSDARSLAEDLSRFERGEAVRARPPGLLARCLEAAGRRPTRSAAVTCAGIAVAAGGLALALWFGRPAVESAAARAARLTGEGRFPAALVAYRDALEQDPESVGLWSGLARSQFAVRDLAGGLTSVDRALQLDGTRDPTLRNLRAALLDASGEHARAQEILIPLTREDPENLRYRFNLAHSLDAGGQVRAAYDEYLRVLDREPRHRQAKASLAWLHANAREPFTDLRDPERATRLGLELLAEGAGEDPPILATLVDLARILGRPLEFAEALERASAVPTLSDMQRERLVAQARALRMR